MTFRTHSLLSTTFGMASSSMVLRCVPRPLQPRALDRLDGSRDVLEEAASTRTKGFSLRLLLAFLCSAILSNGRAAFSIVGCHQEEREAMKAICPVQDAASASVGRFSPRCGALSKAVIRSPA